MVRDSEATKARLFDAAVQEFAAYGIDGARLDRIAETAHANKQLIYRYFGDKREFFDAVLDATTLALSEAVAVTPDGIAGYVDAVRAYHRDHPHVIRLLMWEALDGGRASDPDGARRRHYAEKVDRFKAAQDDGLVDDSLPAEQLTLILLGLITFPQMLPQLTRLVTGTGPDSSTVHDAILTATRRVAGADIPAP